MRQTILILLFTMGVFFNLSAQVMNSIEDKTPQQIYDFHISKKKANNTAAWITLGGGVAMIVWGIGINLSGGILDDDTTNNSKGLWLSYLGAATTLTSIPLFISAGKHKKKAKIQLQNGAVGFNNEIKYSGISIVFSF